MRSVMAAALIAALGSQGCGGPRFRDQHVVWSVDDMRSIEEPEEREYLRFQYFADIFALRRLEKALALPDREPAWDVNALEEVPDSSWFQNRIGRRPMTVEEIVRGPRAIHDPGPTPPYTVVSGKSGGGALGFVLKDANGRSFLVKFDRPANPEMQTGTNVLVNRFFYAFGYHVPADYVLFLQKSEIQIGKDAQAKDEYGKKVPYTRKLLDEAMDAGPPPVAGMYRATASELLPGKPKGGFPAEGVRSDDPNDRIPHQHRRELRGLRVLAAWLNHTDMKEDNTLDMYVEEGGRKFLRHYFVDFGEALGAHGAEKNRREDGFEHLVDWENQTKALFTFGLWTRPWEDLKPTPYKSVGIFGVEAFDPPSWHEAYPYWPFMEMDASDAFWAAKIVMRFSREAIAAVVAEAKLTEPGAAEYLTNTLVARRDRIGQSFLEALSPLDDLELRGETALCATDLGVHYRLASQGAVELLRDGEVVSTQDTSGDGRFCVPIELKEDYVLLELRVRRGEEEKPALQVHVARKPTPHIIGLVRDP